ncbi:MAG: hypothetical protein FVQ79_11975 [Planctomycetes bacterium]|nr:hypothetical protein [Planctomycetota bacterium]
MMRLRGECIGLKQSNAKKRAAIRIEKSNIPPPRVRSLEHPCSKRLSFAAASHDGEWCCTESLKNFERLVTVKFCQINRLRAT